MSPLRLGTDGLFSIESKLIEGLLKLHADQPECVGWTFVEQAPFDVLIVDVGIDKQALMDQLLSSAVIVRISPVSSSIDKRTLSRLILSDDLLQCLALAKTHIERSVSNLNYGYDPMTLIIDVPDDDNPRYMLAKWPPDAVLRNDPSRIRMSKMLKDHDLMISQLAQMTQEPIEKGRQFIHVLRSTGLLLVANPSSNT